MVFRLMWRKNLSFIIYYTSYDILKNSCAKRVYPRPRKGNGRETIQCVLDQGLQGEVRHWITVSMHMVTSGFPSLLFIYYLSNYKKETISLMCIVINVSLFLTKWTKISDLPMKNSNLRWMSWCVRISSIR